MTPKERKEQFVKSLQRFTNKYPTLYGLNTKELESLMTDIAGVESSYRSNIVGRTKSGKASKYNGYYALKIPANTSVEEQHKRAFKHLANVLKHNITDVDVYRAGQIGISQAQLVGKYWNQGNRVTNYLWNGIDTTDGNGIKISEYGTHHGDYRITSDVNILRYVPDAIMDSEYKVKKGDTFSNIQERVRTDGRNYNRNGKDIIEIEGNEKLNPNNLRIGQIIQIQPEMDVQRLIPTASMVNTIPSRIPFKRFGGKLRYGWGGMDRQSYALNSLQKGYSESLGTGHSVAYWINEKGYNKDYMLLQNPTPVIGYMPQIYIQQDGSVATYQQPIYGPTTFKSVDDLSTSDYYAHKNQSYDDIQYLTDQGRQYFLKQETAALDILNSMKTRVSNDISQQRNMTAQQIARFGGLIGVRRKYPYGGTYVSNNIPAYSGYMGWGTEVKPEDISYSEYEAKGEGIVGSEIANKAGMIGGIGAGIGTLAGAAAGTALGAWGGPIGMAAGALIGSLIGIFTGRKKRNEEEANRRELLAEQKENNRQNTISNMDNRYENDIAKIRTSTRPTTFAEPSFYMKHGGMIKPRMKYNNGGTILPNSSDTAVAYGRTHEQVDPMTGETGITYGNAEVEGGGFVGGKELPGEVIQQTPNGDRIYSDSLYVPGMRATYAQIAKVLTDKKGAIEQEISTLQETLDNSLDAFNKSKLAKAKAGTTTRNIEKLASKLNLKTGELVQVDAQLNDVFASQEQMATVLGLRDIAPVTARFGGYRPKYKFGIPEIGLLTNGLSFIGNMLATGLSSKSNLAQLDFMSKLPVPKTNKVEAEYYTVDTSPYDEASRTMFAETRRLNKWIEDNVSNPQVLRNQKRKNLINYYEGLSDINAKKSDYLSSRYDLNRNARIAARNANNQGKYQDAVNEYNKTMQIVNSRMSINNQTTQNYMASLNQLMQAVGSYGNQKMYLASLPQGVQNEFYIPSRLENMTRVYGIKGLTPQHLKSLRSQGVDLANMRKQFRLSAPGMSPLEWINNNYLNEYHNGITLTI